MIDFIKIYTNNKEALETNLKNKFDDTICSLNYYTGELQYPCRRYFENMEVRITNTMAIVRNSIHKYFNMINDLGSNNYTDFYYSDMIKAFDLLQIDLDENIEDCKITNLEFGLNIRTSQSPKTLLENNFIMYNFDDFSQIDTFGGYGYYKQYNRREYLVKIYDKGLQFRLPYNLMRVEIKITDSKMLKNFGIYTTKDIYNKSSLKVLFNHLIKAFDEINIIDNGFTDQKMPHHTKTFIEIGKSSSFWREIKQNKSSSHYYDMRDRYNMLLDKYELNTIKQELKDLLVDKFDLLIEEEY
ncbi:hypothetical protein HNP38_002302 [Chryseobacterium defluvii]|uniref:Uncharacterized protein n=1 Tax=Chryseobacterium defluvii TaxID=160396 RepID=A0A840KCV0_9FLAO|nr:hypothetical protein [Chryseobacterium defluvii]MBB4807006.1 hypothetical protein [Chryseobacterium defluvii]